MSMKVETVQLHEVEEPAYSVVIPIRNRHGHILRNCLKSVELQTLQPLELIIVDYGSTEENYEKLMKRLPDCTVYRYETDEPWSLAIARNIGLRRATAEHSCSIDADLILEPRVLEVAHGIHTEHPRIYMSNHTVLLNPAAIDPEAISLPQDYEKLVTSHWAYLSEGWGGFVSASTHWWHECWGFDERMTVWGWEDVDMWKRAARAGMDRRRLNDTTEPESRIFHIYHPNVQLEAYKLGDDETLATIRRNEKLTKASKDIRHNDENWGVWT